MSCRLTSAVRFDLHVLSCQFKNSEGHSYQQIFSNFVIKHKASKTNQSQCPFSHNSEHHFKSWNHGVNVHPFKLGCMELNNFLVPVILFSSFVQQGIIQV